MRIGTTSHINYGFPVNWQAPLNRGLVAWYYILPQRYGGLRLLDLVGRKHGTLTSIGSSSATSGWGSTTRRGGYGEMRCDGTNDNVALTAYSTGFSNSEATVTWWSKTRTAGTENVVPYEHQSGNAGFSFFPYSNDTIYLGVFDSSRIVTALTPPVSLLSWVHFALTTAAGTNNYRLYFNGVNTNNYTRDTFSVATGPYIAGGFAGGFFGGSFDDIRVYNRPLSPSEIAELYIRSRQYYPQELNRISRRIWIPTAAAGGGLVGPLVGGHVVKRSILQRRLVAA